MEENQPTKKTFNPIIVAAVIAFITLIIATIGILLINKDTKTTKNIEMTTFRDPVSALQRNQRDTERKNEVSRVATAINDYRANNRGKYPQTEDEFGQLKVYYLSESELGLSVKLSEDLNDSPSQNEINITPNSKCEGDSIVSEDYKFTATVGLESGGVYCLDV